MTGAAVKTAWKHQGIWSATASALKHGLTRTRRWVLALLIGGAAIETLAAQLTFKGWPARTVGTLGALGAAALAVAAFLRSRRLGTEAMRDWLRARSASEALKEAVYLEVTGASTEPLNVARDRILTAVKDLEPHVTHEKEPDREAPGPMTVDDYIRVRVDSQIEAYYRRQASDLARRLARIRRWEMVILLAGVILGALAPFVWSGVTAWVAVLTTISGALVTETEAQRYQYLIISYRTTARRLETLRDEWRSRAATATPAQADIARFIQSCEGAISAENESWMAEWVKES